MLVRWDAIKSVEATRFSLADSSLKGDCKVNSCLGYLSDSRNHIG